MKIAILYNRDSQKVINLFGSPNREKIGLETLDRLANALRQGGHVVRAIEADKDLVDRLEEFMPQVVHGEQPGMAFNVSYGIQGQARYTHVPSILEMMGVPYVASGPLAHSLALDKVVTKMLLRQEGLPTPEWAVLDHPEAPLPKMDWPLIVKPKNEAVSFGLAVVRDESELREAAGKIFEHYHQPVLVEQFIAGREINVGLIGNGPPEALPPVELAFGEGGPGIYTYEDKTGRSGRRIGHRCPAPISEELTEEAKRISVRAFQALGLSDCARVDMRLDEEGKLWILEINSLPSLGEHGSFLVGADAVGMDFGRTVNRLVEVASSRYFGTPEPPALERGRQRPSTTVFSYITQRRDEMERKLEDWVHVSSPTQDALGVEEAQAKVDRTLRKIGLLPVPIPGEARSVACYETTAGLQGGTLVVVQLDVPGDGHPLRARFRREPEWLSGDGIASSRAPLVMLEMALRGLRTARRLDRIRLGVALHSDEGRDARDSAPVLRALANRASRVVVLHPVAGRSQVITQRRGHRTFRLRVEGEGLRAGKVTRKGDLMRWTAQRIEEICGLQDGRSRVSISALDLHAERLSGLLPHRVTTRILVTYPETAEAEEIEARIRTLPPKRGLRWELRVVSDRPPMTERKASQKLLRELQDVAEEWKIPLERGSSTLASVAGLVPEEIPRLCGLGPVGRDIGTPNEAVQRLSLMQRTLLLALWLAGEGERA